MTLTKSVSYRFLTVPRVAPGIRRGLTVSKVVDKGPHSRALQKRDHTLAHGVCLAQLRTATARLCSQVRIHDKDEPLKLNLTISRPFVNMETSFGSSDQ